MAAATDEAIEKNSNAIAKVVKQVKFGLLKAQDAGERTFTFGVLDQAGVVMMAGTYAANKLSEVFSGNLLKNQRFAQEVRNHDPKTTHPVYVSLADGGFEAAVISTVALKHTLFVPIGEAFYDFDLGNSEGSKHICQQYSDYLATRDWKNLRVSTTSQTQTVYILWVCALASLVQCYCVCLFHITMHNIPAGGVSPSSKRLLGGKS